MRHDSWHGTPRRRSKVTLGSSARLICVRQRRRRGGQSPIDSGVSGLNDACNGRHIRTHLQKATTTAWSRQGQLPTSSTCTGRVAGGNWRHQSIHLQTRMTHYGARCTTLLVLRGTYLGRTTSSLLPIPQPQPPLTGISLPTSTAKPPLLKCIHAACTYSLIQEEWDSHNLPAIAQAHQTQTLDPYACLLSPEAPSAFHSLTRNRTPVVSLYILHCSGRLIFAVAVEVFHFAQFAICLPFVFIGVVVYVCCILSDVFLPASQQSNIP